VTMRRSGLAFVVTLCALLVASTAAAADNAAAEKDEPTKPPRLEAPAMPYRYQQQYPFITPAWFLTQLLPSPEVAIGEDADTNETKAAFGLRWQLTPALWSWGVHRRISGWRFFVVDPLARMSGSLAFEGTFEYIGGHVDRVLARPGVKATFPLFHRGEYLAFSMGTSVYAYDSSPHVAHDVGLYMLWGLLGVNGTYAPDHKAMSTLLTLRIRYF
jgi:hypothetical protein